MSLYDRVVLEASFERKLSYNRRQRERSASARKGGPQEKSRQQRHKWSRGPGRGKGFARADARELKRREKESPGRFGTQARRERDAKLAAFKKKKKGSGGKKMCGFRPCNPGEKPRAMSGGES